MDPAIALCRYKSSFDTTVPTVPNNVTIYTYDPSKKYVPSGKHPTKNNSVFDLFQNVSHKPFVNRDAIVLADIDATFNFTGQVGGYILTQPDNTFSFLVIDDGPGGFTQYLMYRNPDAYGYTISNSISDIDTSHVNIFRRNLKDYHKEIIRDIQVTNPVGVDVVIANSSGQNHNSSSDNTPEDRQRQYHIRLLTALKLVKFGGTFIAPISGVSDELLYITSQCFDKISLFKPISAPSFANNYLICQGLKPNNLDWITYLYNNSTNIHIEVPPDFTQWVRGFNNISYDDVNIDTYKCKAIWNLPVL